MTCSLREVIGVLESAGSVPGMEERVEIAKEARSKLDEWIDEFEETEGEGAGSVGNLSDLQDMLPSPSVDSDSLAEVADERRSEGRPTMVVAEETHQPGREARDIARKVAAAITSETGEIVRGLDANLYELPQGSTVILNQLVPSRKSPDALRTLSERAYPACLNVVVRTTNARPRMLRSADVYAKGYDGNSAVYRCLVEDYGGKVRKVRLNGFGLDAEEDDGDE